MKPSFPHSFLIALLSLGASPFLASAQQAFNSGSPGFGTLIRQMPPEFESQAEQLRSAPANQYDFSKSNLGDVLRFLATDAKISFISLSEDNPEANKVVTFSIHGSPFSVLETLCEAHSLTLLPKGNGMWYIRPADDRELIGRSYLIKYNAMERVENAAPSGSTTGGGGTIQSASVDLQGAPDSFKVNKSDLIANIRNILDLHDETGGVGGAAPATGGPNLGTGGPALSNSNDLSSVHQPKIIWNSDSNTLYVVATRLQHLWVEGYLASADKPQSLIAMEVKFIETSRDPTKELGLDWTGTLGTSGTFRQTSGLSPTYKTEKDAAGVSHTSVDHYDLQQTAAPNKEGGFRADGSLINMLTNLNGGIGPSTFLNPAVLSAQDLSVRLRALLQDQDTKTVSYPRMVTLNNHEVVIRSVVNQPVLDGSAAISGGGGSAAVSSKITYLPIGTVLNILPKKMEGDHILLNIKVTISSIIGEQLISGNPYPVATSRVYNAPVEVNDGYTVAIGGLDEAKEQTKETGVPFLGKIPVLGYLFKTQSRAKNHKNLMMFITPMLIDAKGGGLGEEPVSVLPRRPNDEPRKPQIDNAGNLAGGVAALPESIAYLSRECDKIQATIDENRATDTDSRKLTDMKLALNRLDDQVTALTTEHPESSSVLTKAAIDLAGLHERVSKMKRLMLKKAYY